MKDKSVKIIAYEKYKLNWMADHSYGLDDFARRLHQIMMSDVLDIRTEDELIEAFEEIGFSNGEIYVCYREFLDNEYQDVEQMQNLLTKEEYDLYLAELSIK